MDVRYAGKIGGLKFLKAHKKAAAAAGLPYHLSPHRYVGSTHFDRFCRKHSIPRDVTELVREPKRVGSLRDDIRRGTYDFERGLASRFRGWERKREVRLFPMIVRSSAVGVEDVLRRQTGQGKVNCYAGRFSSQPALNTVQALTAARQVYASAFNPIQQLHDDGITEVPSMGLIIHRIVGGIIRGFERRGIDGELHGGSNFFYSPWFSGIAYSANRFSSGPMVYFCRGLGHERGQYYGLSIFGTNHLAESKAIWMSGLAGDNSRAKFNLDLSPGVDSPSPTAQYLDYFEKHGVSGLSAYMIALAGFLSERYGCQAAVEFAYSGDQDFESAPKPTLLQIYPFAAGEVVREVPVEKEDGLLSLPAVLGVPDFTGRFIICGSDAWDRYFHHEIEIAEKIVLVINNARSMMLPMHGLGGEIRLVDMTQFNMQEFASHRAFRGFFNMASSGQYTAFASTDDEKCRILELAGRESNIPGVSIPYHFGSDANGALVVSPVLE